MKQLLLKDWPKGLNFQLMMIADEAVEALGLNYEAYWDDGLGLHFVALIETEVGPFAVRRGASQPDSGTNIWCIADGTLVSERTSAFLQLFDLDESSISWRSPSRMTTN